MQNIPLFFLFFIPAWKMFVVWYYIVTIDTCSVHKNIKGNSGSLLDSFLDLITLFLKSSIFESHF